MAPDATLTAARALEARGEWAEARARYAEAEAAGATVDGDDLHRWGMAAYWDGDVEGALTLLERAADAHGEAGRPEDEALLAMVTAQVAILGGHDTTAGPAFMRAERLLRDLPSCPAAALKAWAEATMALESDADEARRLLTEALEIAREVDFETVEAMAASDLALLDLGEREVGPALAMAEEAGALALAGQVEPLAAGAVLCRTVSAHRDAGDWLRAADWADTTWRWLERTRVSMIPGMCRFHRCEIRSVRGDLEAAEDDAVEACEELARLNRPALGPGYRELGHIRLRRGDLDGAEEAFREARACGEDAQPGVALLRLERGDAGRALAGLEEAVTRPGVGDRRRLPVLLPALVTVALAAGATDRAVAAVQRLQALAERSGTMAHRAAVAQAQGEVSLAEGDGEGARAHLAEAWRAWGDVGAPYEAARAQLLLGRAERLRGDEGEAALRIEAATSGFERLGARRDAERARRLLARAASGATGRRTFAFSDIVDSTRLQTAIGDSAWSDLLAWHDRVLREELDRHDGLEVKHEGDGLFAVFDAPDDALGWACAVQSRLAGHRREHGFAPRLRIGVHGGEAVERDGDYFGAAVTTAARLCAAAEPDQVLATGATVDAVDRATTAGPEETVELKGLPEPLAVRVVDACS